MIVTLVSGVHELLGFGDIITIYCSFDAFLLNPLYISGDPGSVAVCGLDGSVLGKPPRRLKL